MENSPNGAQMISSGDRLSGDSDREGAGGGGTKSFVRGIPRHAAYFVAGAAALALLSTLQKTIIGASFTIDGYIVPTLYGGVTGALIGVWAERLRRQNRRLVRHIVERQYLLRDLHHRIQNNLQIVSSLLYLDSRDFNGLNESRARIDLMALLHNVLYDIEADYHVDLAHFFPVYVAQVCTFQCDCDGRTLVKSDSVVVPLDTAVVLGMIINEVVAELHLVYCNAAEKPRFDLRQQQDGRCVFTLTVFQDVPDERVANLTRAGTFRCDLIESLGDQIGATLAIGDEIPFRVLITFDPAHQRRYGSHSMPAARPAR